MRLFLGMLSALALFLLGTPAHAGCSVELNSATSAQLETLPGIGPAKAAAILEYRSSSGPFTTVEQLDNVTGIGPATLANLRPYVCVGEGDAAATGSAPPPSSSGAAPAAPPAAAASGTIDINTASAAQLEGLPGIGPSKAAAIVAERTENGPFGSCNDLTRVLGIGEATVAKLAASCTASQP